MSLKPRDLELMVPLSPAVPEPVKPVPEPSIPTDTDEEVKPSLEKPHKLIAPRNWQLDGKPIHGFRIQSSLSMPKGSDPQSGEDAMASEKANIMKVLENGSGDIAAVMPILASVLLNSSRKVSLRLEEENAKHIAIITVKDIPTTQTISVLKSLTISGSDGDRAQRSVFKKLVLPGANTAAIPTRFWLRMPPSTKYASEAIGRCQKHAFGRCLKTVRRH